MSIPTLHLWCLCKMRQACTDLGSLVLWIISWVQRRVRKCGHVIDRKSIFIHCTRTDQCIHQQIGGFLQMSGSSTRCLLVQLSCTSTSKPKISALYNHLIYYFTKLLHTTWKGHVNNSPSLHLAFPNVQARCRCRSWCQSRDSSNYF